MEYKKISIVTINLNNKEGLERTINSVIKQTYFDKLNYIIIDGDSYDGSKEVIDKYSKYFAYFISEKDNGIFNAMNKGIDVCNSEYVLFLNSGDYFHDSNVIELAYDELDKDIIYGELNVHDNETEFIFGNHDYDDTLGHCVPHQAAFTKLTLLKNNKFKENYKIMSDWIFFYEEIKLKNTKYKRIPIIISDFFNNGVSSDWKACLEEREKYLKEKEVL